MLKNLLTLAAAVAATFSASAAVIWQSTAEEGVLVDWGQPCVALSADEVKSAINLGDFINVTTAGIDPENGWPQVALFAQYGGWPPLTNEGVGGKDSYPYVSSFAVTDELYNTISAEGLSISGNGAYVSKVEVVSSGVEVGPNTVWFGNKTCGWGNGVAVAGAIFENIAVGDQLKFWTSDQSYQVLLGGWEGLNLPCYSANDYDNVTFEDGVATYTMIEEYASANDYDGKELNVFELIKTNGVIMHGTTTITRIDYIPASTSAIGLISSDSTEATYYGLNGQKLQKPAPGQIVIQVINGSPRKVLMK